MVSKPDQRLGELGDGDALKIDRLQIRRRQRLRLINAGSATLTKVTGTEHAAEIRHFLHETRRSGLATFLALAVVGNVQRARQTHDAIRVVAVVATAAPSVAEPLPRLDRGVRLFAFGGVEGPRLDATGCLDGDKMPGSGGGERRQKVERVGRGAGRGRVTRHDRTHRRAGRSVHDGYGGSTWLQVWRQGQPAPDFSSSMKFRVGSQRKSTLLARQRLRDRAGCNTSPASSIVRR